METNMRDVAVYRCVCLEGMPAEVVAAELGLEIDQVLEICARRQTLVMEERERGCAGQTLQQLAERELHLCGERLDFLYSQAMLQRRTCDKDDSPVAARRSSQLLLIAARLTREKVRVTVATAKLRADLENRTAANAARPSTELGEAYSPPKRVLARESASTLASPARSAEAVAVRCFERSSCDNDGESEAASESRFAKEFAYERAELCDAPANDESPGIQQPRPTASRSPWGRAGETGKERQSRSSSMSG